MGSPTYGDYEYPDWAKAIGWCLAMCSIVPLPAMAVYQFFTTTGSPLQVKNIYINFDMIDNRQLLLLHLYRLISTV